MPGAPYWVLLFLYWRRVEALRASGKSLWIYQHFIRKKRLNFIQRMLEALRIAAAGSFVEKKQRDQTP